MGTYTSIHAKQFTENTDMWGFIYCYTTQSSMHRVRAGIPEAGQFFRGATLTLIKYLIKH